MLNKYIYNYFLVLFSIIPVSIIIGPSVSLSNIFLIDISFLTMIIYQKNYKLLGNGNLKYFLLLYLYLIFNSLISIDPSIGIYRNFGFIRIIIFFIALNYFFNEKDFLNKVLIFWLFIISIVILDIYLEVLTGSGMSGKEYFIGGKGGQRVVSFFKDEPIVGGYIFGFYLIIIGCLLDRFDDKYKIYIFLFAIIFLIAIFITGERSNAIRSILAFVLFLIFYKGIGLKLKIGFLISTFLVILIIIFNSNFLKLRFVTQFNSIIKSENIYFTLYKSGYQVFKNNKINGVGNKNYRIETCKNQNKTNYVCSTHAHQIYFDLLSEHGLVGFFIIFFIMYKLIFSKIKKTLSGSNYLQIGSLIYLLTIFFPLLPSGAFFGDFSLTLFILNLGIFYAASSTTNLFKKL
jgi:O-antigen ligase